MINAEAKIKNLVMLATSETYRRMRRFFLSKLDPLPTNGDHVLDLGCGEGIFCREIATYVAPRGRVVGLDIDEGLRLVAQRLTEEAGMTVVEYLPGDAANGLPFEDNSFNTVVCCNMLKEIRSEDRQKVALSEMVRVLCPGGQALVADTGDSDDNPILFNVSDQKLGRRVIAAYDEIQGHPFPNARMLRLCQSAGLENLRMHAIVLQETTLDHATAGYALAENIRAQLIKVAQADPQKARVSAHEITEWYNDVREKVQNGTYFWSMTKAVCVGRKPA
jgi:ubiquinone/menaquinone biosynthesis C-methylase UbiE